jgi:hypothetical protein
MKGTYTKLETVQTADSNTIIFDKAQVALFFKKGMEHVYASFSPEEQQEWFSIHLNYGDLLQKIWKDPLSEYYTDEVVRNPTEEYNFVASTPKDPDLTDEEHEMKLQRLLNFKIAFESK